MDATTVPVPGVGAGMATVPGTCGELAQGFLDGGHFQITCPIDLYAVATVTIEPGSGTVQGPTDAPKARRGVELVLDVLWRPDVDATLHLENPTPRGKGMGSSTADVSAAIAASSAALGTRLTPAEIAGLAVQVEPSDGSMLPGIAFFDHRSGRVAKVLGPAPPMRVIVLDFGGTVDTFAYNSVDRRALLESLEDHWREAVTCIEHGLETNDLRLVGMGASISAAAHQTVLHKPQLAMVQAFARASGALGVNVAHSGVALGILLDDDGDREDFVVREAFGRLPGLRALQSRRLVDGGVHYASERGIRQSRTAR